MRRSFLTATWQQDLLNYATIVEQLAADLAELSTPGRISEAQRTEIAIPLLNDMAAWFDDYNKLQVLIRYAIKNGLLTYDMELDGTAKTSFDSLYTRMVAFREPFLRISQLPTLTPEEAAAEEAPAAEPAEIPDDLLVLANEVERIVAASRRKKPEPALWAQALSAAVPLFALADYLAKEEYGTAAEQFVAGAQVGALAAITQLYGATTFAAFMLEEGCQAVGMSGWIAYNAKAYDVAFESFKAQDELIRYANNALEIWRPLMPLTYPGFVRFFKASRTANDAWFSILYETMQKAALPLPPTLAVQSRPSGARVYIDDEDTGTLTPETFKYLSPGSHTVTAIIPATAKKAEMGASQEILLVAGRKLEISLELRTLEEAGPPVIPPTEPATLRVSSSPSDGAIFLDGASTGTLTPETFKSLAPGAHTVLVVVPPRGGWPERRATITLTLAPGEKREISLSPTIP